MLSGLNDNTNLSLAVTFAERGRYVVEAEARQRERKLPESRQLLPPGRRRREQAASRRARA